MAQQNENLRSLFEGKTNGEVILMLFPNLDCVCDKPYNDKLQFVGKDEHRHMYQCLYALKEWWDAPYSEPLPRLSRSLP